MHIFLNFSLKKEWSKPKRSSGSSWIKKSRNQKPAASVWWPAGGQLAGTSHQTSWCPSTWPWSTGSSATPPSTTTSNLSSPTAWYAPVRTVGSRQTPARWWRRTQGANNPDVKFCFQSFSICEWLVLTLSPGGFWRPAVVQWSTGGCHVLRGPLRWHEEARRVFLPLRKTARLDQEDHEEEGGNVVTISLSGILYFACQPRIFILIQQGFNSELTACQLALMFVIYRWTWMLSETRGWCR